MKQIATVPCFVHYRGLPGVSSMMAQKRLTSASLIFRRLVVLFSAPGP